MMKRIVVYIYSLGQIPTQDFIDREGAIHACARAGSLPFEKMAHYPGDLNGHLLSVEEKNAIAAVEAFCKKNGYHFEIVDFAELNFLSKIKLKRKGVKTFPTISCGEKFLYGVPHEKELEELVQA
jgi:glutaredoxin